MVARSQVLSSVIMGSSTEKEKLGLTSRERVSLITLTTNVTAKRVNCAF